MPTGAQAYHGCKMTIKLKKILYRIQVLFQKIYVHASRGLRVSFVFEYNALWNIFHQTHKVFDK